MHRTICCVAVITLVSIPSVLAGERQISEAPWTQVIPRLELKDVTIVEALAALKPYGIQVGLELKPVERGKKHATFSLVLESRSLPEIVSAIVASAEGYSWEVVMQAHSTTLIHVFPTDSGLRFDEIMDLRVQRFEIKGDMDPTNAINQIRIRIPELWRGQGYFASLTHIAGEEFVLTLEDKTVREILNEIALRKPGLCWLFQPIWDETAPDGVSFTWRAF